MFFSLPALLRRGRIERLGGHLTTSRGQPQGHSAGLGSLGHVARKYCQVIVQACTRHSQTQDESCHKARQLALGEEGGETGVPRGVCLRSETDWARFTAQPESGNISDTACCCVPPSFYYPSRVLHFFSLMLFYPHHEVALLEGPWLRL